MNTLNKYLNSFECYKPLPAETVNLLVSKAKKGDRAAVSEIIYSHQRFIIFTAKKFGFIHNNVSDDALMDIISAGNVGLLEAINRYDNTKDSSFLTCAEFGIRNALGKNAHETRTGTYLPFNKAKKLSSIKKLFVTNNLSPTDENAISYIAQITGTFIEEIKEILSWDSQVTSIEGCTDNTKNPIDAISYKHSKSVDDEIEQSFMEEALHKALNQLSSRQKTIITLHFGINCEKKSLTEIGKILQLSKQRVAQIEKDIFKTLRESEYATTLLDFVA